MWLSIAITLNFVLGASAPRMVLNWWPWSATARSAIAVEKIDGEPSPVDIAEAKQLAHAALIREPISVEAARALALAHAREGDIAAAGRLFAYAETLSRRDLPTQLWLIESAVARDDIADALHHYDRALRTSRSATDLLMPTLITAADDSAINTELAVILGRRPNWWMGFFSRAVRDAQNLDALVNLARAINLDVDDSRELGLASALIDRLLDEQAYELAFAMHRDLVDAEAVSSLRDGEFNNNRRLSDFDWVLRDEFGVYSRRESIGEGAARLALYASGGDGGWLARQMLVLSPGRYRLSGTTGNTGTNASVTPRIILRCARGTPELARQPLPPASMDATSFVFDFVVPMNECPAQQIEIATAPAANTDAWIDSLILRPAGSAAL